MNNYVIGSNIKTLREKKGLTQAQLAEILNVSDKAVSRWETAKGYPDITLIEPLAKALGISVIELFSGSPVMNKNVSGNFLRSNFHICPVCGNVIHSLGEAVVSCCGMTLPPADIDETDETHKMSVELIDGEYYVTLPHEMTKQHYISFIAYVTTSKIDLVKLYPEGSAEARFFIRGDGYLYAYCNHHGLIRQKLSRRDLTKI